MDYWKTYKHTHTQTGDYVIDMLLSCHNNGREMQTKQDRKKWLEKILQHSNTLYDEKGKKAHNGYHSDILSSTPPLKRNSFCVPNHTSANESLWRFNPFFGLMKSTGSTGSRIIRGVH